MEICYGFLTGNFSDEIDAVATAAKYRAALQAAFPDAVVNVDFQRAEGSLPPSLCPAILIDGEPALIESAGDTIRAIVENVEPVYAV
jgi:hypothetical protein